MEAQSAARSDILGVHRDGHRGGHNVGDGLHMGRGLTNVCRVGVAAEMVSAHWDCPRVRPRVRPLRTIRR